LWEVAGAAWWRSIAIASLSSGPVRAAGYICAFRQLSLVYFSINNIEDGGIVERAGYGFG
jgi:hypothetical protein